MRVHFWYSVVPRVHELRAEKRNAEEFKRVYGSEPADFVRLDFYVDDGIKSIASAAQATALKVDLTFTILYVTAKKW